VMASDVDDLTARLALSCLCEPGDPKVGALVSAYGASAVLADGLIDSVKLRNTRALDLAFAERESLADLGAQVIVPGSSQWPSQLDDLGVGAPLVLRVLGSQPLRLLAARGVAIVGARSATRYGQRVADELAAGVIERGFCVISGAAFGIDAAAHLGALAAGGATVAVSAAGADVASPSSHQQLFDRIRSQGCVVSEVPLGTSPSRHRFLIRNRLIAALSRVVVVVEAARRSGALSTARQANEIGRIVAAVPGPVTSAASAGCHQLMRDGEAVLVTSALEVHELAGVGLKQDPIDPVNDAEILLLFDSDEPVGAEEFARKSGVTLAEAVDLLLGLASRGFVVGNQQGWVRTRS